ncbi:MAG: DUF106 domain-containing protein [Nanohaloarchaea archaeon]|nr:DUF106 domain-containing protein [Candidatus Nanohaloarchaea archaeon]
MASIQGFLNVLFGFYDTLFQPILSLGPLPSLAIFSGMLAGMFSIIYYIFLDIEAMDEIKEKINEKQEKRKEAQKNDNVDEATDHMKEAMSLNQEMMMLNFKPMIVTMICVAFIFPWLGATFAPSIDLQQTSNSTFEGDFQFNGQNEKITIVNDTEPVVKMDDQNALIGGEVNAFGVDWDVVRFGEKKGGFFSSGGEGHVLKMNARFVDLPFSIPLAGAALNWLGTYILISMPLTFLFRKMLGIQ